MGTQKLTLELPEPIFYWLARLSKLTQQSPEELAVQSIAGNLPPSVEDAPPEIQAELWAMQQLPVDELLKLAHSQAPIPQQERHLALLEKNQAVSITPEERQAE